MLSGNARSKKEAALLSGFSPAVANNAHAKIEKTEGFHNAMIVLATKSNNLMLAAMHEFEARGLTKFSNTELIGALNAIGKAWERVEKQREPGKLKTPEGNRLRGVLTRKTVTTETAVVESVPTEETASAKEPEITEAEFREKPAPEEIDMDF